MEKIVLITAGLALYFAISAKAESHCIDGTEPTEAEKLLILPFGYTKNLKWAWKSFLTNEKDSVVSYDVWLREYYIPWLPASDKDGSKLPAFEDYKSKGGDKTNYYEWLEWVVYWPRRVPARTKIDETGFPVGD